MYQVIARKYRPQRFEEVVGQAHVKLTIKNAIAQGRIAHAYIFSGPRGTGKTTMARILAMALNWEDGPSASPDPDSQVCKEIAAGSSLDVVEIDAASNRGIDSIRELRESVKFRPARDRYKVFIIDEAHQITNDAFNALLKTLEEPPSWTVFVLCTTEPQAIPATITSRCQSFAFQAVDQREVVQHLGKICASEGVAADADALTAVALAGDGSVRDSLSTLDQAIAAFGDRLEAQAVRDLLGVIPGEGIGQILGAIRDSDPAAMLAVVDDLFRQGRNAQHFCGELTRQFRNLMVMKVAGYDTRLVSAGHAEREAAKDWIGAFSQDDLNRYVQILLSLYQDLQSSTHQRFRLEVGLLKLVHAGRLAPIEEVLSGLGKGAPSTPRVDAAAVPVPEAAAPAAGFLEELVHALRNAENESLVDAVRACRVDREERVVTVHVPDDWFATLDLQKPVLEAAVAAVIGAKPDVRLVAAEAGGQASQRPSGSSRNSGAASSGGGDDISTRALSDPAVQAFTKRFEGRVTNVVDLREKTR
ncbi:MAG: DNA polymerase III subunit gamma/tau [Acidobacteriia bacterium]|nr:DNA polymerase III subunit gamma/tau [Terriglobia bacterium]MYG04358.1 DNA polymerase III subunit gamma/tau [Terriglobia bacterium]MYK09180.1 DNA polymerase III subunit gamma/tau [Terriglobia bacterium]